VTSAIRLHAINNFGDSPDPTWQNVDIAIWTCVELTVGIFCCNIPAISSLVKFYLRRRNLNSSFCRTMPTHPTETLPRTFPPPSSNNSTRALATVRSADEGTNDDVELRDKERGYSSAGGVWCKTEVVIESEPYNIGKAV
jgi:hypothetical protein